MQWFPDRRSSARYALGTRGGWLRRGCSPCRPTPDPLRFRKRYRQQIRFGQSPQDQLVIPRELPDGTWPPAVRVPRPGRTGMTFQRIVLALVVLLAAGLAGSFYMNWK